MIFCAYITLSRLPWLWQIEYRLDLFGSVDDKKDNQEARLFSLGSCTAYYCNQSERPDKIDDHPLMVLFMKIERQYSLTDKLCMGFDQFLRALGDNPKTTGRDYPGGKEKEPHLSPKETKEAAALMRINHAGEICAQALYHGQALGSRNHETGVQLRQAAIEEGDHLAWCHQRLVELGSHPSYLNPFWYLGSFCIGLTAGLAGDRWSLGFLAETEKQVVQHLSGHLERLPETDEKSMKILRQMQLDEEKHRQEAIHLGGATLPPWLQKGMSWVSKVMVKIAYWI